MSLESDLATIVHTIRPDVAIGDAVTEDGTSGWLSDTASVTILPLGYVRQGIDERRTAIEGDSLRERVYGNRTLRIQFTCETNRQTLELTAQELADDLVAGFNRTDIEDILAALNLGVPVCMPVRTVDYQNIHGDIRSAAVFEAQFPASRRVAGGLIAPIKSVEITGTPGAVDVTIGPV